MQTIAILVILSAWPQLPGDPATQRAPWPDLALLTPYRPMETQQPIARRPLYAPGGKTPGHWVTQSQCGSEGCTQIRIWVEDTDPRNASQLNASGDAPRLPTVLPKQGHWERRRGWLFSRLVYVEDK